MIGDQWRHDLRQAWRGLLRSPAFVWPAVLTLAVGITGATTMFAVVSGVLLRPLPVRDQDRLVVAWTELRDSRFDHFPLTTDEIAAIGREGRSFERVAGVGANGVGRAVVIERDVASELRDASVTGDFFEVLGVDAALGRTLNRADDVRGAEAVLVIGHGVWQRRYGGSPAVIGRRLVIAERPFTIVGVMPADLEYPSGAEAWMTVAAAASLQSNPVFADAEARELDLVARLRPGVTIDQAAAELQTLIAGLDALAPGGLARRAARTPVVRSYSDAIVGDVRLALFILFGAVALVLVIASANVANLLLLRGEARRSELAVRAALGATRARLARQVLVESACLALIAAALGAIASRWVLPAIVAIVPDGLPRLDAIRIDGEVVGFAAVAAFVAAAFAGLAPAWSSARLDLVTQLRHGGRGATGGARRARRALVVAQVAMAVTVVAIAGVLVRSLWRLQSVDLGLAADRLVFATLELPPATSADRTRHLQFLDAITAALVSVPGVAAATPVGIAPFAGPGGWDVPRFTAEGQSVERAARNPSLNLESVHPTYFETFGVALTRGRAFTAADRPGAPLVAILSEDVVARLWPGQDPLGKRVRVGGADSRDPWRTVVGVGSRTRYRDLALPPPTLYLPAEQFIVSASAIALRTTLPIERVAALVRSRVGALDAGVRVLRVVSFSDLLARPLARPRFNASLILIFATIALLLAVVGLYAVIAAYVRQRVPEIGVRVALGATAADIRRLVLGEGLRLAVIGAAIGLGAALAMARLVRGLLFEIDPLDPMALTAAVALLVGASALASYLPARRAMRVDPVATLRTN